VSSARSRLLAHGRHDLLGERADGSFVVADQDESTDPVLEGELGEIVNWCDDGSSRATRGSRRAAVGRRPYWRPVNDPRRPAIAAVLMAFVLSRLVAFAAGMRFDSRKLVDAKQIADLRLLHHHLAESLWWMHGQPPLYNLYVGVVVKAFPGHLRTAFFVTQLLMGVVLAVAMYLLLEALRLSPLAAAAGAIVVVVSPPVLLYEWMLFYDYPTLVLVTLSALFFVRMIDEPTLGRTAAFFATTATLTLTRTIFHPLWFVAQLGLALAAAHGRRRTLAFAAAVPLAAVALIVGKNVVQFGVPGTSSWLGLGLSRLVLHDIPRADLRRLVGEGRVDRVALVDPFGGGLASYRSVVPPHRPTGHAILDERRMASGNPNFFNLDYVAVSRHYLRADRELIEARPRDVATSVKRAFEYFFQPESNTSSMAANRNAIRSWDSAFQLLVLWSTPYANRVSWLPALLFAFALGWGALVGIRALRGSASRDDWIVLYCWLTLLVVGIGGNLAEAGENYRFRLVVDPLLLVLGVLSVRRLRRTPDAARQAPR
jgi:hypothetical protein